MQSASHFQYGYHNSLNGYLEKEAKTKTDFEINFFKKIYKPAINE